jgi:chorismate mutase
MASLDDLRTQIDAIDSAIVDLLARRLQVCTEVAEIKAETGAAIIQPARSLPRRTASKWPSRARSRLR